jgi:integrase
VTGKPRKCRVRGALRWYVDAKDPLTGKRKRTLFQTQAAADDYQQVVNLQPPPTRMLHALVDPDVRLAAFAADWFWSQSAAGLWRPATQRVYGDHLANRILAFRLGSAAPDVLGNVKVRDLTRGHVEALVTGLRRDGFAPATVRVAFRLFSLLLDRAVTRGLLERHPVDRDLHKELRPFIRATKGAPKAFTHDQAARFLAVTRTHSRLHALYETGFCTGLRIGELTGLRLEDHRPGRLTVERSLSRFTSMLAPTTGPTKNGKTRSVDVGSELSAMFDRLAGARAKQALRGGWRPVPGWMFVTSSGHPYDAANVNKDFRRMRRLAGLGDTGLSPHSMRHSFACWHIAKGCNPKWLQQQLGHASIGITFDTYGDWFNLHDAGAADDLAATLLGNGSGNRGVG